MDIENFNQCLQYLQIAQVSQLAELAKEKGPIEKFIPLIGTLSGAVVGFFLTQLVSRSKENKTESNKTMCCKEDISRLQESVQLLIKEAYRASENIALKEVSVTHQFPASISSLFLAEYFTDVAHKFNKEQRHWIQLALQNIEEINKLLVIMRTSKTPTNGYPYSLHLLNLTNIGTRTWLACQSTLKKETEKLSSDELARAAGCTEDDINYKNMLEKNAKARNNFLDL